MSCWRRNFSFLLFVCAAVALQIFLSSQNVTFVGAVTTASDPTTTDISASSHHVGLSGRTKYKTSSKSVLDQLYQDGMWFGSSRTMALNGESVQRRSRKSIRCTDCLWPNAEVPYDEDHGMSQRFSELLHRSFEAFHLYTCIRFRPKQREDRDYVRIFNEPKCSSYVGRQGGEQQLSLGARCFTKRIITQVLGYVIGLMYQHNRPDRDDYVTIRFQNVLPSYRKDLKKFSNDTVNFYNIPYDYLSIMHFDQYVYSNGEITIETKNTSYQNLIGKSTGLSFRDAKLANIMYKCSDLSGCKNLTCPGEGFVGQDCRCWCSSENSNTTAEHCAEVTGATNTSCHEKEFSGQDCRCECPSKNSSKNADYVSELTGGKITTCYGKEIVSQYCQCQCPSGNSNNTYEHRAAEQANDNSSTRPLDAIAVGCTVSLSAILAVFIFVVHRRRQRTPNNWSPVIPASENKVVKTIVQDVEYYSQDDQSSVHIYDVPNDDEPRYIALQPDTVTATYCELQLYETVN